MASCSILATGRISPVVCWTARLPALGYLSLSDPQGWITLAAVLNKGAGSENGMPELDFPLIDAHEVSEMLGQVPVKTVGNLAREGRIPSVVIGRRRYFSRRQVEWAVAEAARRGRPL